MGKPYNDMELMICVASRLLEDGATTVVGTGAPCAAAMLAQKTHSPDLTLMFEAGGVAPLLPRMPISVGDSRTFFRGLMATSMNDIMKAVVENNEPDHMRRYSGTEKAAKVSRIQGIG